MTQLLLRLFVGEGRDMGDPAVRSAVGRLAGITGIACNLLLFAAKLAAGLAAGSVSAVGDAVNNLSDASASVVTLLGFKMARQPADRDHPYGHARYEHLSGLVVAALILLIGAELAKVSVGKMLRPVPADISAAVFWALAGSVAVKLWMSAFFASLGGRIGSTALAAAAADSRNDVAVTLAVLAGCLIERFGGVNIDGYVGLAVAAFILWSGVGIAKETVSPLLGRQADRELLDRISGLVLSHQKILGIHDLLVHDYGPGQYFASVHVELSADEDPISCHDIIDGIERDALSRLNVHLVIHYDPVLLNDEEQNRMRLIVEEIIRGIDPRLSMHDFRIARGAKQPKLIFDLTVPYDMEVREKELGQKIDGALQSRGLKYAAAIRFDREA